MMIKQENIYEIISSIILKVFMSVERSESELVELYLSLKLFLGKEMGHLIDSICLKR